MNTKTENMLIKARDARAKAFKDNAIFAITLDSGDVIGVTAKYSSNACRVYLSDGWNVTEGVSTGHGYDKLTSALKEAAIRMMLVYKEEGNAPSHLRVISVLANDDGGQRFDSYAHPVREMEGVRVTSLI